MLTSKNIASSVVPFSVFLSLCETLRFSVFLCEIIITQRTSKEHRVTQRDNNLSVFRSNLICSLQKQHFFCCSLFLFPFSLFLFPFSFFPFPFFLSLCETLRFSVFLYGIIVTQCCSKKSQGCTERYRS